MLLILGLSAGATLLISGEIEQRNKALIPVAVAAPTKQNSTVLICTRDLPEGSTIVDGDVATRTVEADRAPVDALSDPDAAIGHSVKFPIAAGSLVSSRDLAPLTMHRGFQSKLRAGERAVTFAVDNSTGVAGFVAPDSYVDVMIQVGSGGNSTTRAILSDVRVVASGTAYQKVPGQSEAQPASTVTVAVQPVNAAKLINAMAAGRIYLTLRSDVDHTPIAVSDINSLFRQPGETTVATVPMLLPPQPPIIQVSQPADLPPNRIHEIEQFAGANRNLIPVKEI